MQRRRPLRQDLGHDRLHAASGERRVAGQHLVEHGAQRVHVAPRVDHALAHRLLGTHVLRRPEGEPGLRDAMPARRLHRERDAEIRHDGLAIVQENVLRLDVAMNDVVAVGVVERARDFARDAHGFRNRQLPFASETRAQRLSRHSGIT